MNNYFLLKRHRSHLKEEKPSRRLVAVMLLEHLGDIVACEPVVRYLRKKDHSVFIVWGVKRAYRELIDSNSHIDMTLSIHCLTERMLLIKSGLFDEVIDLHFIDRYCSLCRKPLKKDNNSKINLSNYFNFGSLLSAMAQSAGLPALDDSPKVYIPHDVVKRVDELELPHEFIAINCTSNADEKGWPKEKWELLLRKVQEKFSIPVFEIGLKPFVDPSSGLCRSLCGQLSILESAEVIRRAKLFVGIDSGPAHLANAVSTPGVILMGSYLEFNRYNPFSGKYRNGTNAKIIYSDDTVDHISPETVFYDVDIYLSEKS